MSERKMRIRFPMGGAPIIEMTGYAGEGCVNASKWMEEALGVVNEEDRELQSEFYEEVNTEQLEEGL